MAGRWRWLGVVVVLGAVAVAVTVLPRHGTDRAVAALLLLPGLLVGAVAGLALSGLPAVAGWFRASRPRTGPERLNDIAFSVVLVAVWALATAMLGRWSGLLTGLVVGAALALASRTVRAGSS